MKINNIRKVIYYFLFIVILFSSCAKIVSPTGGPKDEQHPLIEEINPPDYSTHFKSKEIEISFDEFIQLKELNNNLIISPPVKEKPEIKVKGKSLQIKFTEDLKDSTTYNIYFGSSVQDFNEGNPIENFQYVLSTGSFIDSLSIQGQIINSFNLLPEAGVFAMLYSENEDSIPLKEIPIYVSKTDKEGLFRINNIKHGIYKLFCLRDLNKNYLFDILDENIAFIDSLVTFELLNETLIDTVYKSDSSRTGIYKTIPIIDSIVERPISYYPIKNYTLRLFTEDKRVQYLANNKREKKHKVDIIFNKPYKDSVVLSVLGRESETNWYIREPIFSDDTLTYWISDSSIYNREELSFLLSYQKEDSNLVYQWNTDTLNLKYFEIEEAEKQKKKEADEEIADTSLKFNLNIKNRGTIDLNSNLNFVFENPLQQFDTTKINLFAVIDSIKIPVKFNFKRDGKKLREYHMEVDWGADTIYHLEIYPNAFTDIYNLPNDTNIIEFASQKLEYYAKVIADITGIDSSFQVIGQLILPSKDKETIYREKIIKSDQLVEYGFLPPKEFMYKVIIDKNFNGKWDTGDYLIHLQPEEVLYYEKEIKLKSNWDFEINFNVKKQ